MTIIALDPVRHAQLRIAPSPDMAHAARLDHAVIGLAEAGLAATDYPLVLIKDGQTGRFHLAALLGLGAGRNLFVLNGLWHATYLPETVLRYPFFRDEAAPLGLAIDDKSGLLGNHGEPLFNTQQMPAPVTLAMAERIEKMMRDRTAMTAFVDNIVARRLLRALRIDLTYQDGGSSEIGGLYGIDPFALAALDGDALAQLNQRGHLAPMFVMIASLNQLNRLEQLHNAQTDRPLAQVVYQ
ncbi:MAG: SapC family protein [Erythrobacter sp.]|nr:SapC family protein [Erythrobacter sp.]